MVPRTRVILFRESDGAVPLLEWLARLPEKVRDKCVVRLRRLAELGYELRRPEADLLGDGIYELRVGHRGRNYRMLYFFHRDLAAVVSHGLVKERAVPPIEIERAIQRRREYMADPLAHTAEM